MAIYRLINLFKDLFQFLPGGAHREWSELRGIDPKKPTIILVSGFIIGQRALSVMRKRLIRDQFNVVIFSLDWQTLSDGENGLYEMAEKLSTMVLEVRKNPGGAKQKIFVVAHSAGGLVARYYVQLLGGSHYCDGLITLATPHHGTWIALLGLLTHLVLKAKCLFQLLPSSNFVKETNAATFPDDFKMISIFSRDDLMCPRRASRLPESLAKSSGVASLELKQLSHSDFLLTKQSYQIILSYLTGKDVQSKKDQAL